MLFEIGSRGHGFLAARERAVRILAPVNSPLWRKSGLSLCCFLLRAGRGGDCGHFGRVYPFLFDSPVLFDSPALFDSPPFGPRSKHQFGSCGWIAEGRDPDRSASSLSSVGCLWGAVGAHAHVGMWLLETQLRSCSEYSNSLAGNF